MSNGKSVHEAMFEVRFDVLDSLQALILGGFAREQILMGAVLGLGLLVLLSFIAWAVLKNKRLARDNRKLNDELHRLDNTIEGLNAGAWELRLPEKTLTFDGRWAQMLGYMSDELAQGSFDTWAGLVHPLDVSTLLRKLDNIAAAKTGSLDIELRMLKKCGNWQWIGHCGGVIRQSENGRSVLLAGISREISEEKRSEEDQRLGYLAFLQAPSGFLVTDKNNQIVQVNPAFSRITGYSRDEVLGKSPGFLLSADHEKDFYQKLWLALKKAGRWDGEVVNRHKEGHTFVQKLSIVLVRDGDGEVSNHIAIFSDISLQKQLISALEHSANHDMLTGLPNRNLLQNRIKQAISQARRSKTCIAVVFLDLDKLKLVNDTYGHAAGDALLRTIARRVMEVVREGDTVARLGGDEFVVVLNALATQVDAMRYAEKLLSVINQPVRLQRIGQTVQVSASLGVIIGEPAVLSNSGPSPERLLELADELMYQAKREGRSGMIVQSLAAEDWQTAETGRTPEKS